MSDQPTERQLVVLTPTAEDPGRWGALVDGVAEITDAVPFAGPRPAAVAPDADRKGGQAPGRPGGPGGPGEPGGPGGPGGIPTQLILERATGTPVLVLPASDPSRPPAARARLRRMLVPMDRSLVERRTLRPLIERAQAMGVDVRQLHVLARTGLPAMWEGSGHHAEAWLVELRRRHQPTGTALAIVSGDPVERILSAGRETDLVVLCWHRDASPDRAGVVRAVLDQVAGPVLLVPVDPDPDPDPEV